MQLSGIEKALKNGCKLHGFRSGGGLRVISIEKGSKSKGYGEHPNVEDALSHANEDVLAGGREYKKVYGKLKPHYLTGSQTATSSLDDWLLRGNTIDAYAQKGKVIVELRGYAQTETPDSVNVQIKQTGQPVVWLNRGYTYETRPDRFPNGEHCESTRIISKPEGKNVSSSDPWMYNIVKTGEGKTIFEAIESALNAEEIEEHK